MVEDVSDGGKLRIYTDKGGERFKVLRSWCGVVVWCGGVIFTGAVRLSRSFGNKGQLSVLTSHYCIFRFAADSCDIALALALAFALALLWFWFWHWHCMKT